MNREVALIDRPAADDLNIGLGVILSYVGMKMMLSFWGAHIPALLSLG